MTEEKEKQGELNPIEIIVQNDASNVKEKTEIGIPLLDLSINDLILKMVEFSNKENCLTVSKDAEEVRSIFYQKLKDLKKENEVEKEENQKTEKIILHPHEIEFKRAYKKFKSIKNKHRKEKDETEQKNFQIKKQIIQDIDSIRDQKESIRNTFVEFKLLQEKWKSTGNVPIADNNNLWQSYHHHVELFYDYIQINKELRNLDFRRNFEEKISICKKAEKLINEKSLNKIQENLQELHEHWSNVGPVAKKERERIWERFQKATKLLHKKKNDYFLQKKEENNQRVEKKNKICNLIDNLTIDNPSSHQQWQKLIEDCNKLSEKWRSIGRLNKKDNSNAWKQHREVVNNFYIKRKKFYENKKQHTQEIIKNKKEICKNAEELKYSKQWKETSHRLIQLQKDWKNTGFVSNNLNKKLWERFENACNVFFDAKKEYFKNLDNIKKENFNLKQSLLKKIKEFIPTDDGKKDFRALNAFSKEWKKNGLVPHNKENIEQDFLKSINNHYEKIKMDKEEILKEQFLNKITYINGNTRKLDQEKKCIQTKLESVQKMLNQYKNNISFFGKNKKNDILREGVKKKIESTQKEIKSLKEKMRIIEKF